jgi:hypothetical protein
MHASYTGAADCVGVRHTQQVNTSKCASISFPYAHSEGLVLYEPFGGLCAGLEMVLLSGLKAEQYITWVTTHSPASHAHKLTTTFTCFCNFCVWLPTDGQEPLQEQAAAANMTTWRLTAAPSPAKMT